MTTARSTAPVGAVEQALWALDQLVPGLGMSNLALAVDLERPVDLVALREALAWLLDRHIALRTSFPSAGGIPVRRVLAAEEVTLLPEEVAVGEAGLADALRAYGARPFDLEHAPLFRTGVFEAEGRHVICLVVHHIVLDGASVGRIHEELGAVYDARTRDEPPPRLPPAVEPMPFSPGEAAVSYWRGRVDGYTTTSMRLAEARAFTGEPTFAGGMVERDLEPETRAALGPLRSRCRSTDAMVLLAAYYLTLRRLGAGADMMVGLSADTRRGDDLTGVGYLVATVPLRVEVPLDISFAELVTRVTRASFAGIEYGPVPFEVLADAAAGEADAPDWWRTRLVRHLFNYWPRPWAPEPFGTGSTQTNVSTGLARLDLEFVVQRRGQTLRAQLVYSTEVHDAEFARRFLDQYEQVLRQAAADPDRAVGDLDLCSAADHRLAVQANDTAVRWPAPHTVPGLVAAAAAERPDAVAVEHDGTETTYAQLVATAGVVREQVERHAGPPGSVVAVALPRGVGLAAAILGVWAAGRGYLPLDPTHPAARLAQQLDEAGCRLVIGGDDVPEVCRRRRTHLPEPVVVPAAGTSLPEPAPEDVAYLIFTSGSTGRPKGVVLTHANLANVVRHFRDLLPVRPGDAMTWLTTFAFDISVLELVLPLASGGRVVVAPDEMRLRPAGLLELVERRDVRIVQATPTTWRLAPLPEGGLAGRVALCGGEPMPPALARDLLATGASVFNVYGPTETTIWSTAVEVTDPEAPITVGRPIANTQVHVLTERGHPQPAGLVGELCIGGAGVALGYHGRPDLTDERFVDSERLGRYYRTGDLARRLPDGTIELLGRADRQVKLRAHRIELGEVESALADHPDVTAAAVVVSGDPGIDGVLVAFVVPGATAARSGLVEDVWAHATTMLPTYAVPSRITMLDTLPTTPNGKIDHTALTERAAGGDEVTATARADVPHDPVTDTLVALWRTTLGRPGLGHDANFFLSGGHSLLAARLAGLAADRLGVPITMATVFRAPTPAALAAHVRAAGR